MTIATDVLIEEGYTAIPALDKRFELSGRDRTRMTQIALICTDKNKSQ